MALVGTGSAVDEIKGKPHGHRAASCHSVVGKWKRDMLSKGKLLIIDDDQAFGELLSAYAKAEGFHVELASSLSELGSFAMLRSYDLVLLDFYLHHMQGDEIAEYVQRFFDHVPVVIISAQDFTEEQVATWPDSVRHFIRKDQGAKAIVQEAVRVLQNSGEKEPGDSPRSTSGDSAHRV